MENRATCEKCLILKEKQENRMPDVYGIRSVSGLRTLPFIAVTAGGRPSATAKPGEMFSTGRMRRGDMGSVIDRPR